MFKSILIFYITIMIPRCVGTMDPLNTIKERGVISKMNLKISSPSGLKRIIITNANELDSINIALMEAKEIHVQDGGVFDKWADVLVFKNGKQANFMVQFSKYNGWVIAIENKTFKSDFIFHLIERYNG